MLYFSCAIVRDKVLRGMEAFEMWVYKQMLKIKWIDRVTNESVFQRLNRRLEMLNTVNLRKTEYLGRVINNPEKHFTLNNSRAKEVSEEDFMT